MAKKILELKMQCTVATKNQNGAVLQFSKNMQKTQQDQTVAREAVHFVIIDKKVVDQVDTVDSKLKGKTYIITITEE